MKRLLFVLLAACTLLLVALIGVAAADGGPHGGYTPTTDGCAGCHRAHTAQAPRLLIVDVADLCLSCHGTSATGADTNVEDGVYVDTTDRDGFTETPPEGVAGRGLKGGGFVNTLMSTDFLAAISRSSTSAHTHDGSTGTRWGSGPISLTAFAGESGFSLSCTNCHDPHGNGQYRILRPIPTGSGIALPGVTVPDETTKNYTINPSGSFRVADQYYGEGYKPDCSTNATENPTSKTVCEFGDPASLARRNSATGAGLMTPHYIALTPWCSACHTRYSAGSAAGETDSGDAIFKYRHLSNASAGGCSRCHDTTGSFNPVPGTPGGPFVTHNDGQFRHELQCMTCHVSHGTSADMTTDGPFSGTVAWPDGATSPSGDARSSLLRVDGRGVCQGCHNKSPAP